MQIPPPFIPNPFMSPEEEKIQKIIRLKRYEVPPEGYFDDFLEEFQKRRDAQTSPQSSATGLLGRSITRFRGMGAGGMVVGGGLAYAALIMVVLLWPKGPESRPENREPVIFQPPADQGETTPPPKKPKEPLDKF